MVGLNKIMNTTIEEKLISKRFANDGVALMKFNYSRQQWVNQFMNDNQLKYEQSSECALCLSKEEILIAKKDRYGLPLETVVCENCGLIRTYSQMDEASQYLFYSKYFRNIEEGLETDLDSINKRYESEKLKGVPKYVSKDSIVVELGCGGGWKLLPYHNRGYKYYGFDYDKDFINLGRKRGLNIYCGDLQEAFNMGIKADYVILSHVLEHVKNPVLFLKELKIILNKDAIVSIWGPSLNLFTWGYLKGDILRTLQISHNYLFDEFTLSNIGICSGYRIVNFLGANLIMQKCDSIAQAALPRNLHRGSKVLRYLAFIEVSLYVKKFLRIDGLFLKNIYYLLHPFKTLKKFLLKYFGFC